MCEKLHKKDYLVKSISHLTALMFIEKYHYAKSASLTSVFSFGLFKAGEDFFEQQVLGVSFWLPPTKNAALTISENFQSVLSLSRLAVHPSVPSNACSFLLARSRKLIKQDGRFKFLLTFADTFENHNGAIYLADNWTFLGKTKPTPVWVNAKGQRMGAKRAGKNLTKQEMVDLGFEFKGNFPKYKFSFTL